MSKDQSFPGEIASNDRWPSRQSVAITQLARRLGVTARALRHYEDMGLIKSERTAYNVRAYNAEAVAVLETIVLLRKADVPLPAIREVVSCRSEPEEHALAMRRVLIDTLAEKEREAAKVMELLEALNVASGPRAIRPALTAPKIVHPLAVAQRSNP